MFVIVMLHYLQQDNFLIKWVDDVNWLPYIVSKADISSVSPLQVVNASPWEWQIFLILFLFPKETNEHHWY